MAAIKCLDEGVNIPGIRTAFILASTTNPKEYIQRRGRVLRKADNKPFAEIYDFVTLPRPLDSVSGLTIEQANRDKTLVKNELARIKEFGTIQILKRRMKILSDNGEIQVDSKTIERLKRSIIIKENMNLKTRTMNDSQMVAWIKKKIEEEVQCYLNQ